MTQPHDAAPSEGRGTLEGDLLFAAENLNGGEFKNFVTHVVLPIVARHKAAASPPAAATTPAGTAPPREYCIHSSYERNCLSCNQRDLDKAREILDDYRNAPSGVGPLAAEWKDKPHRLVYDLVTRLVAAQSVRQVSEEQARAFWNTLPHCCGYPDCDGDLVATPHSQKCPLFGRVELNILEFAVAFASSLSSEPANLQEFWNQHSAWSQATFGSDSERGPIGPLKHLEKEAREAQDKPSDLEEFADCLFLTFDATRRAGFTLDQLTAACFAKLEKNKLRKWGPRTKDGAVEHIREEQLCVGCDIELSDKLGSLMDGSLRGTPHTCGKAAPSVGNSQGAGKQPVPEVAPTLPDVARVKEQLTAYAASAVSQASNEMLDRVRSSLKARAEGLNQGGDIVVMQHVDAIVAQARREERERCAKVAHNHIDCGEFVHGGQYDCAEEIEREIRGLSDTLEEKSDSGGSGSATGREQAVTCAARRS